MIHKGVAAMVFAAVLLGAAEARADNLLRGPHPFLGDNELSLHGGYGVGFGDTFSGPKGVIDYGYKLAGSLWLDLAASLLSSSCPPPSGSDPCADAGDAAEVLAGFKYKLRMTVPVVPYAKLAAGLAYLFPEKAQSAVGILLRAGIGGKYFLYDWLGVGAEVTFGLGRAAYGESAGLGRSLAGFDLLLGVETQF